MPDYEPLTADELDELLTQAVIRRYKAAMDYERRRRQRGEPPCPVDPDS